MNNFMDDNSLKVHGMFFNRTRNTAPRATSPTWSLYDDAEVHNENFGAEPTAAERLEAAEACSAASQSVATATCKPLRSLKKRAVLKICGQGVVYAAIDPETGEELAVKRIFTDFRDHAQRGHSECVIREFSLLRLAADHPNVLKPRRVVLGPQGEVCLAVERCRTDLATLVIDRQTVLPLPLLKFVTRSLLRGLAHLHGLGIIHRDVKCSNGFPAADGNVRLGDLGSARIFPTTSSGRLTPAANRITMMYRPPECLLGVREYTTAVDVWAMGVCLAELVQRQYLFRHAMEIAMIGTVWKLVGTPTDETWPGFSDIETCRSFRFQPMPGEIESRFASLLPPEGVDLLKKMLTANPAARITAAAALQHPFFADIGESFPSGVEAAGGNIASFQQQLLDLCVAAESVTRNLPSRQLQMQFDDDGSDEDGYY